MTVISGWHLAVSALCFAAYGLDKRLAKHGPGNRIPEFTLLVIGAIGGWPGGVLAQNVFRHKTRKTSFQIKFWLCALVHVGIIASAFYLSHGAGS